MAADQDDDDADIEVSTPRPFWSGTVAFGLVSLPVSLFPAHRGRQLSLRMVDAEGTPLARRSFCEKEGKPLERDEIVRGYELDDGSFVTVEEDELESVAPERSREIDLRRFVRLDDIDPMHFERAWFMVPDDGATKAYRLLAKCMEDEGRAGIATFVMRGKEYLCAIVAEKGILRAATMRFHDELRTPADIGLPEGGTPSKAAVQEMARAIRKHASGSFEREELEDAQAKRLLAHVRKKLKSGKGVVKAPEEAAGEIVQERNVVDLMEVLKDRLKGTGKQDDSRRGGDRETATARKGRSRARPAASPGKSGGETRDELRELLKDELYERAQALDIAGRSQMSKQQLLEAISQHH